jgi:hypothetical protein
LNAPSRFLNTWTLEHFANNLALNSKQARTILRNRPCDALEVSKLQEMWRTGSL